MPAAAAPWRFAPALVVYQMLPSGPVATPLGPRARGREDRVRAGRREAADTAALPDQLVADEERTPARRVVDAAVGPASDRSWIRRGRCMNVSISPDALRRDTVVLSSFVNQMLPVASVVMPCGRSASSPMNVRAPAEVIRPIDRYGREPDRTIGPRVIDVELATIEGCEPANSSIEPFGRRTPISPKLAMNHGLPFPSKVTSRTNMSADGAGEGVVAERAGCRDPSESAGVVREPERAVRTGDDAARRAQRRIRETGDRARGRDASDRVVRRFERRRLPTVREPQRTIGAGGDPVSD